MAADSRLGTLLASAREKSGPWRIFMYVALAFMIALNLFIHPHHPHFRAENVPGFWALFGLGAAIGLARICKGAAHTFLGKPEDYYDRN